MTGRTHDLAAFTAISVFAATQSLPEMRMSTLLVALTANFIGGLTPDIDQPTADLWHRLPAGGIWGHMFYKFLGGHRTLSHSLLGFALFGVGFKYLLDLMSHVLLTDMNVIWWAFMIGFGSHLIMDTFTHDGVPWLFPLPWHFGIPPLRILRMKTGGIIEKYLVFPGLILINLYIYYTHYDKFLDLLHHYIK